MKSAEADVHHLLPRSMGGTDELSNLVTLCDGCHASHHPNLAGGLARRVIERWAVRLARWLDSEGRTSEAIANFGPALRLFGLDRFRQGQLPIVLAALSGKSVLVVSPTGSGKTLCFQLPAVLRRGLTVVVSPLKALMAEQVSDLLRKKVPATFINSDLSTEEKQTRFSLIGRSAIKLLYLAPERFFVRSEQERQRLKRTNPTFLVVDEAHCVDQWGRDFRREYGRLREVREKLGSPPVLAFTATAGHEMQQRIMSSLGIDDAVVFVRDVDRPNIALARWKCATEKRGAEIATLLRLPQLRGQKAMIFVPSVAVGEKLQQALRDARLASVEDQLQEFGRAGRDGKPSVAVMFHNGSSVNRDVSRLRFMAEKTVDPTDVSIVDREHMIDQRFRQIDQVNEMMRSQSCMREAISTYFQGPKAGERPSLSVRILDWVFGSRLPTKRFRACCDHCDRAEIKRGMSGYVARVLS